ncbi:glutaredoxin family protein [Virgibacillus sp. 179-BFC.A HS]|uniref:Glutaredoxin family protein n=1 Tax=Tigheibacillus jepli TaxID=3035914 RepID=A0ABU5CFN0_9BACI|nr:glutaredoxin family protein [Virgibacillus sp. 179-BFC.A HS]MDY0405137.1 glutaredoxin family protein [Virgibacillus sp. 179-BFC.A HS]
MLRIIYYTKQNCSLCDNARALLGMLQNEYAFDIEERDIYTNDDWLEKYQLLIPCVQIGDMYLDCEHMDLPHLEQAIQAYSQTT